MEYFQFILKLLFSSPDPKGYVSYCHHKASVVRRHCLLLTFYILIFSSETTGPIRTKLGKHGPWVVPSQNYIRRPAPPTKMAVMAKNRKFGKKNH